MHAPPLLFLTLGRSRTLAAMLALIHGLAVLSLCLTPLPWWLTLAAVPPVFLSCIRAVRHHALRRAPESVIRLQSRADGSVECLTRDGEWKKGSLASDSTLFPVFAVLRLKPEEGACFSVVLFPDALAGEDWRELSVWLRWAASDAAGRPQGSV